MELLERVVGEHGRAGLVGDAQHEGVASTDGPRRRGDELVVGDPLVEVLHLGLVDAMPERRVDDDGDRGVGELLHERHHGVLELGEARQRPSLGGDVGPVDDDVLRSLLVGHAAVVPIVARGDGTGSS
jgi:hypothetical protein